MTNTRSRKVLERRSIKATQIYKRMQRLAGTDCLRLMQWMAAVKWAGTKERNHVVLLASGPHLLFGCRERLDTNLMTDFMMKRFLDWFVFAHLQYVPML